MDTILQVEKNIFALYFLKFTDQRLSFEWSEER